MFDKCTKCFGTKKAEYMGGMQRECDQCHGLGYIDNTEPKKVGRPKKEHDKEVK